MECPNCKTEMMSFIDHVEPQKIKGTIISFEAQITHICQKCGQRIIKTECRDVVF